jgi:hypothetical protein
MPDHYLWELLERHFTSTFTSGAKNWRGVAMFFPALVERSSTCSCFKITDLQSPAFIKDKDVR